MPYYGTSFTTLSLRVDDGMQQLVTGWNAVSEALNIPPLHHVLSAGSEALRDGLQAAQSASRLTWLLTEPVARALVYVVYWIAWFVYQYILVEGLYQHGLSQAQALGLKFWTWQTSLTTEQLLWEAALLVTAAALYQLRLYLQRNQYLQKAAVWMDQQQRQWNKAYRTALRRIARSSIVLAALTAHILFVSVGLAVAWLLPLSLLARPKVIGVLSFWFPLWSTVTSLLEYQNDDENTTNLPQQASVANPTTNNSNGRKKKPKKGKQPTATSTSTLTVRLWQTKNSATEEDATSVAPRSNSSRLIPTSEHSLEEELQDWLRFWMVRGAVEGLKCLLSWVTPSWCTPALLQLELLFYLWIYGLPLIQPQAIAGQELPEGRPLRVLCKWLRPQAKRTMEAVSGAIPLDFWQDRIVGYTKTILAGLVLVRALKQPTSDWLVHLLEEGRPLVIPALTLLMPGVLTGYGIVYVQYFLSIAKTSTQKKSLRLWLRYWVLNALIDATLQHFSSLLWWIPFSNHAIFVLYCYLSLPKTVDHWYTAMETEMKKFGLLIYHDNTGDELSSMEDSHTARFLAWVWGMLPKAAEDKSPDETSHTISEHVSEESAEMTDSILPETNTATSNAVVAAENHEEAPRTESSQPPASTSSSSTGVKEGGDTSMPEDEEDLGDESYVVMTRQDTNDDTATKEEDVDIPTTPPPPKSKSNRSTTRSQSRALKSRNANVVPSTSAGRK